MKHNWQYEYGTCRNPHPPKRICLNCKVEQEEYIEQSWGRIVRHRWLPLVGRCKGKKIEFNNRD